MRTTVRLLCCVLVLLSLCAVGGSAQEALVLGGGGSRGLAHVGVFQALQERGYDPDIVVGTSMGAVMGALYAAGYEPAEIRRRVLATDWAELFTASPVVIGPERAVRFPMLNLDLDIGRLRFSRGLFGQWRINRALVRLLFDANARSRGDFDRLARRYRAVAADLKTGEAVVLGRGDLARAARASMAVPGFFAPVSWGDRVLVDGGIADNLPTSVARRLGATRIIASEVSKPEPEITSQAPIAVISRVLDLLQENTQRDPVAPDALILPQLDPSLTGAGFPADPTPLIDAGRAAGLRALPAAPVTVGRGERPLPLEPRGFSALALEAADSALAALARQAFAGVAPGKYDPEGVLLAVDRLYSTGLFEGIWPRVVESSDTATLPTLHVRLDAQPELSLAAGAGYDNDRGGRAWGSLDRYTALAGRAAVLSLSTSLGGLERWGALSARVHPQGRLGVAWSTGVHVQERAVRFFSPDAIGTKQALRAGGWLALELPHILRNRLSTAALRAEWIDVADGARGTALGPLLRFSSLPADEPVVGIPFLLEGERRWGSLSYTRLALSVSRSFALRAWQLAPLFDARGVSRRAPADVRPALGDEHAVPGLRWGEDRGRARAVGGVDVAYPVMTGFLRVRLRTGTVVEELDAWERARWITGAQLGAYWQSPLGVVELGYGRATRGGSRFDVDIGRRF